MRRFENIKAILFDIDDTLFPSSKFSNLARENAIKAMVQSGMNTNFLEAREKLDEIVKKYGSNYGKHFDRLVEHFDCKNKKYSIAYAIYSYHNTKSTIKPFKNTKKVLDELKRKKYRIFVASKGRCIKQWDKLIRLKLDKEFEEVFVSKNKDCEFYLKICKKLNIKPNNVLMVGDNPKTDIEEAKKAGLKTIRIKIAKHSKIKDDADYKINSIDEILKFF